MRLGKTQYKKMPLSELVILATQSDYRALEELIHREQKNIFATFTYLNKKTDNVYDLTQEALLRMAKGIVNLKNPKTFKSWLNHIVMNLFYDNLRKINRIPPMISIDDENRDDKFVTNPQNYIPDKKCKPLEKCISNELDRMIKHEMQQLPEHFRVPIILRELQGLTYEEIAEVTQTNVGTVKSRISRARSRLQDGLKDYI
ncbi:sigma-70 family RNA polymerase sigma factor [bacterium]|nr:sigma-70 family RNA polymerase sigma factor [bacterium]